jgi:hypothetical protein
MTFSVMAAADVPARATRTSKTTPLRLALAALQLGEAIEVAYDHADPEGGYRPTTVSQVVGTMSANSETLRFSVRRKADSSGCYIIAGPKLPADGPKRGRKPKLSGDDAEGGAGEGKATKSRSSKAKAASETIPADAASADTAPADDAAA